MEVNRTWDTEKVENVKHRLIDGEPTQHTPFKEGDYRWREANIIFEYSPEEIEEIKKCKKDILYFAEKYCRVMTDEGVTNIELRDYQKEILSSYQNNRFSILLSARQSGKCLSFSSKIDIYNIKTKEYRKTCIGELYFELKKKKEGLTFFESLKYKLWSLYSSL